MPTVHTVSPLGEGTRRDPWERQVLLVVSFSALVVMVVVVVAAFATDPLVGAVVAVLAGSCVVLAVRILRGRARPDPPGRIVVVEEGLRLEHSGCLSSTLLLRWESIAAVMTDSSAPGGSRFWRAVVVRRFPVRMDGPTRPIDQPRFLVEEENVPGKRYFVTVLCAERPAVPNLLVVLKWPFTMEHRMPSSSSLVYDRARGAGYSPPLPPPPSFQAIGMFALSPSPIIEAARHRGVPTEMTDPAWRVLMRRPPAPRS